MNLPKEMIEKIDHLSEHGSKTDRIIAKKILTNPYIEFDNIAELAKLIEENHTACWRFSKNLGYPSFKHFVHEFKGLVSQQSTCGIDDRDLWINNTSVQRQNYIESIAKKIRGSIYMIPSKRANCIAKFIDERLKDGGMTSSIWMPDDISIEDYLKLPTENDTIVLITLSSFSFKIDKAFDALRKIKNKSMKILVTNSEQKIKGFDYEHIVAGSISTLSSLDDWKKYNLTASEVMYFIIEIINKYHELKKLV